MPIHRTCDGVKRRDFLKVGALGGAGLTLSNYLRLTAADEVKSGPVKAGIFIHLAGGPSHLDTFDLKPDAPKEFRGTFNPIETKVPGIEISEHLPKLAGVTDRFTILRGVSHTLGAHALGSAYVNKGTKPLPSLEYPGYGSVVSREFKSPQDIPPFVAIPSTRFQGPGFLGVKYAPLNTGSTPRQGQAFSVRGITLGNGLTIEEAGRRQNLLGKLDKTFSDIESERQLLEGLDQFDQQAHAIITSKRARDAFDISKESPEFTKTFAEDTFSQSCLLATRLVESGVCFVTMSHGGWDTHQDNFTRLKDRTLPPFDAGLASLLAGLDAKGLLESTAVFVTGEFGRTPKINTRSTEGGRDHYPRCMFMLMAGGKIRGGQVLGKSDDKATLPANEAITPDDVAASFYHNLGIDHTQEYHSSTGRPITIVRNGNVIEPLFA
ncbi:MAG: hypothetical protein CMJ48_02380 [Planctomycetaceae bacterium]|nr:hypothetical protein [Planctomycetaceae bacterium]